MATLTDPQDREVAAATRQDFLRDAADMGTTRISGYTLTRQYYEGRHRTLLTDRAKMYLRRHGMEWCENFCSTIVDALVHRLHVVGFTASLPETANGEDTGSNDAETTISDTLQNWWNRNRMNARESAIYEHCGVEGDCFVFIDWDAEKQVPRFTVNKPNIVKAVYDEDDPSRLLYLVKVWNASMRPTDPEGIETSRPTAIRRMNLHWPDRVEKWMSFASDGGEGASWHAWQDEGDIGWPVMLLDTAGSPLGINAVHYRNKARSGAYGVSELLGVIPQQDAMNKKLLDLDGVMDYEGAERWATGVDRDNASLKRGPGNVWIESNADAKFGQFAIEGIDQRLADVAAQLSRMGARASIPLHLLNPTGVLPSGETLKVAEAPMVMLGQDRQVDHGDSHVELLRIAIRWHNTFAPSSFPRLDESCEITVEWESIASRNDESEARTAGYWHDLGVSKSTLMAKAGFNPEEEREKRAEEDAEAMDQGALGGGLPQGVAAAMLPAPDALDPSTIKA